MAPRPRPPAASVAIGRLVDHPWALGHDLRPHRSRSVDSSTIQGPRRATVGQAAAIGRLVDHPGPSAGDGRPGGGGPSLVDHLGPRPRLRPHRRRSVDMSTILGPRRATVGQAVAIGRPSTVSRSRPSSDGEAPARRRRPSRSRWPRRTVRPATFDRRLSCPLAAAVRGGRAPSAPPTRDEARLALIVHDPVLLFIMAPHTGCTAIGRLLVDDLGATCREEGDRARWPAARPPQAHEPSPAARHRPRRGAFPDPAERARLRSRRRSATPST